MKPTRMSQQTLDDLSGLGLMHVYWDKTMLKSLFNPPHHTERKSSMPLPRLIIPHLNPLTLRNHIRAAVLIAAAPRHPVSTALAPLNIERDRASSGTRSTAPTSRAP